MEPFKIECRKTNVITSTLANYILHNPVNQSKLKANKFGGPKAQRKTRTNQSQLFLVLLLMRYLTEMAPTAQGSNAKPKKMRITSTLK